MKKNSIINKSCQSGGTGLVNFDKSSYDLFSRVVKEFKDSNFIIVKNTFENEKYVEIVDNLYSLHYLLAPSNMMQVAYFYQLFKELGKL